jgi:hypothetical protein
VTLHETDLVLVLLTVVAGCAACYVLLFRRLKRVVLDSNLKVADQLAALDDAIRALETRLYESQSAIAAAGVTQVEALSAREQEVADGASESEIVPAEIQAVIAAAAVATLGENAAVRSIRSLPAHGVSPWSQQGRAMVQGSHNLRVRG